MVSLEEQGGQPQVSGDNSACPTSSLLSYLREHPFHQDKDEASKRIESLDEEVSLCPYSDEWQIALVMAKGRKSCMLGTGGLALQTESPSTSDGMVRFHYR